MKSFVFVKIENNDVATTTLFARKEKEKERKRALSSFLGVS